MNTTNHILPGGKLCLKDLKILKKSPPLVPKTRDLLSRVSKFMAESESVAAESFEGTTEDGRFIELNLLIPQSNPDNSGLRLDGLSISEDSDSDSDSSCSFLDSENDDRPKPTVPVEAAKKPLILDITNTSEDKKEVSR
ncbi:unnamed protein product [Calicophoron daubneyi]|uniref:Uncharacterized protein n=1 Tax=Calicophoron daubneyi TaxID=300641 RepID=A0AAV2TDN8_CALDB